MENPVMCQSQYCHCPPLPLAKHDLIRDQTMQWNIIKQFFEPWRFTQSFFTCITL